MTEHNHSHLHTMAAIWGQDSRRSTKVDGRGFSGTNSEPVRNGFFGRLALVRGTVGDGGFLHKHFSVVSILDDEDVRDAFQRTDYKLLRTAAFSDQALWDTLMERGTAFRLGGSREV